MEMAALQIGKYEKLVKFIARFVVRICASHLEIQIGTVIVLSCTNMYDRFNDLIILTMNCCTMSSKSTLIIVCFKLILKACRMKHAGFNSQSVNSLFLDLSLVLLRRNIKGKSPSQF